MYLMTVFFCLYFEPIVSDMDEFLNDSSLRAYENSIPYLVSIEKTVLSNRTINKQCTGLILSRQWVSTSCACLLQIGKDEGFFTWPPAILFRLTTGATNRTSPRRKIRFAIKILYHPQCDMNLKIMDVAMMKLNYPLAKRDFAAGRITQFPVGSRQTEFISKGLDLFLRRHLTCAVLGWPEVPDRRTDFLLELNVVLQTEEECGLITCKHIPGLCDSRNYTENTRGLGFICAKADNTWPPCTGFQGAPLVCGTNVWGTVTGVKPCNETHSNASIVLTRLDVQHDFLKMKMSGCDRRSNPPCGLLLPFILVLLVNKL